MDGFPEHHAAAAWSSPHDRCFGGGLSCRPPPQPRFDAHLALQHADSQFACPQSIQFECMSEKAAAVFAKLVGTLPLVLQVQACGKRIAEVPLRFVESGQPRALGTTVEMPLDCHTLFPFGLPPFKDTPFTPIKGACVGLPSEVGVEGFQLECLEPSHRMYTLPRMPFLNVSTTIVNGSAGGRRHVRVPVHVRDIIHNMIGFVVKEQWLCLEDAAVVAIRKDHVYGWRRLQVDACSIISVVPLAHASRHRVFPLDVNSPKAWGHGPLNMFDTVYLQLTFREDLPNVEWALHALSLNALQVRDGSACAVSQFLHPAIHYAAAEAPVPLHPCKQLPDCAFDIEIGVTL